MVGIGTNNALRMGSASARGAGVLFIQVSTLTAEDEEFWAEVEGKIVGGLLVRAAFGSGSAMYTSVWTAQSNAAGRCCRDAIIHLPYYNLADGVQSTGASLSFDIVLDMSCNNVERPAARLGKRRSTMSPPQTYTAEKTTTVATGSLDVQVALCSPSATSIVPLSLTDACPDKTVHVNPTELQAVVRLTFSKSCLNVTNEDGMQVGACVPACYVVATTLCDYNRVLNEAELQLFIRCGATGDLTSICSAKRGAIAVHDRFEWNVCVNVSHLFSASGERNSTSSYGSPDSLIVMLCETSVSPQREGAIAVLELLPDELISCGDTGRWCPMFEAASRVNKRRRRRTHDQLRRQHCDDVVGEAWIAVSSVQRPIAHALPAIADASESDADETRSTMSVTRRDANEEPGIEEDKVVTNSSPAERTARTSDMLMYFHVWDALVPHARPGSALYLTIRVHRRGAPEERISTRPVRIQVKSSGYTPLGSRQPTRCAPARQMEGAMHVVWDEHLTLSLDGMCSDCRSPGKDNATIEMILSDASADLDSAPQTAIVLANRVENVSCFTERSCLRKATHPETSGSWPQRWPDAVVYTLGAILSRRPSSEDVLPENERVDSSINGKKSESKAASGEEVKVRMASMVLSQRNALTRADEVKALLQSKANIPQISAGLDKAQMAVTRTDEGESPRPSSTQDSYAGRRASVSKTLSEALVIGKRELVVDLHAACSLFRRFAVTAATDPTETHVACSLEALQDAWETERNSANSGARNTSAFSSTEGRMPINTLSLLTQAVFPGLHASYTAASNIDTTKYRLQRPDNRATDSGDDESTVGGEGNCNPDDGAGAHTREVSELPSPLSLSLTEFLWWLRKLPVDALESAGLLVSPQTALEQTEKLLFQSSDKARELADTLNASLTSAADGTFGLHMMSVSEDIAVCRMLLGQGKRMDTTNRKCEWTLHTDMLERDVKALLDAVARLEDEVDRDKKLRSFKNNFTGQDNLEGLSGTQTAEVATNHDPALDNELENVKVSEEADPTGIEFPGRGLLASCRAESVEETAKALHVSQQAAKLACAADHLQESLRSVQDNILRTGTGGRMKRRRSRLNYAIVPRTTRRSPSSMSHELESTIMKNGSVHLQLSDHPSTPTFDFEDSGYNALARLNAAVSILQLEIGSARRRAAIVLNTLPQNKREELNVERKRTGSNQLQTAGETRPSARSALDLVKCIRQGQEAVRPSSDTCPDPHVIENKNDVRAALEPSLGTEGNSQLLFVSPASSEADVSGRLSNSGMNHGTKWTLSDDEHDVDSPPRGLAWAGDQSVEKFGQSFVLSPYKTCRPVVESENETPRRGRFRSSSLRKINQRLEELQNVLREDGEVGIPNSIASTTAATLFRLRNSVGWLRREAGRVVGGPPCSAAAISCPIDRFALHVFRTAGAAVGGDAVFSQVQELAGTGGLDADGSRRSLWAAVEHAGIMDVERWIVGAVLWHVVETVKETSLGDDPAQQPAIPSTTPKREAIKDETVVDKPNAAPVAIDSITGVVEPVTEGAGHEALFLSSARSLWEELRSQALDNVVLVTESVDVKQSTKNGISHEQQPPSIVDRVGTGRETPPTMKEATETSSATSRGMGNRNSTYPGSREPLYARYHLLSRSDSFDRALFYALSGASTDIGLTRGNASSGTPVVAGAGWAAAAASSTALRADGSEIKGADFSVDELLMFTHANSGFAEGSGLEIRDLVDAIKVRRAREASGCRHDRICGKWSTSGGALKKSAGEATLNAFSDSRQLSTDANVGRAIRSVDECASDETCSGKSAERAPNLEGIPLELQELMHRAKFASDTRKRCMVLNLKHRQFALNGGTHPLSPRTIRCVCYEQTETEVLVTAEERDVAEAAVVRVLDSNRTLECAAFAGGKTALHYAAARGDAALVRILLQRGCKSHVKDFKGKRACDLTRDLECLRILGSLKKGSSPCAYSRRTQPGVTASSDTKQEESEGYHARHLSSRALAKVRFLVKFRLDGTGDRPTGGTRESSDDAANLGDVATRAGQINDEQENSCWVEGVAQWIDLRTKVLYVEEKVGSAEGSDTVPSKADPYAIMSPPPLPRLPENSAIDDRTNHAERDARSVHVNEVSASEEGEGDRRGRQVHPRSVLDVRLLSCLSPVAQELFDQLVEFTSRWKVSAAVMAIETAVENASELGYQIRLIAAHMIDDLMVDLVLETIAEEHAQIMALQGAMVASDAASIAANQAQQGISVEVVPSSALSRAMTGTYRNRSKTQAHNNLDGERENTRRPTPASNAGAIQSEVLTSKSTTTGGTDPTGGASSVTPDVSGDLATAATRYAERKRGASQLNFECAAIAQWRPSKEQKLGEGMGLAVEGAGPETDNKANAKRQRRTFRTLVRLRLEGGVYEVHVHGRSYLPSQPLPENRRREVIDLDHGDAAIQRVLDGHGVSMAACVQTFDLMEDMDDPDVVLRMLAIGICQLSDAFVKEGIVFNSLEASEQDALRAGILQRLRHARQPADVSPEWEEMKITMAAYSGIKSVGLTMGGGALQHEKTGTDQRMELLIFPEKPDDHWRRPEDVIIALRARDSPAVPQSAISLAEALMQCNLCEVLSSLRLEQDADGRLAFIGHIDKGDQKRVCGGSDLGIPFRGSLEVAWDRAAGGVFVRQFGVDRDENFPRFSLRAVGIRGFSIRQLPVTLEDIDAVWDQSDTKTSSRSSDEDTDDETPEPAENASSSSELVSAVEPIATLNLEKYIASDNVRSDALSEGRSEEDSEKNSHNSTEHSVANSSKARSDSPDFGATYTHGATDFAIPYQGVSNFNVSAVSDKDSRDGSGKQLSGSAASQKAANSESSSKDAYNGQEAAVNTVQSGAMATAPSEKEREEVATLLPEDDKRDQEREARGADAVGDGEPNNGNENVSDFDGRPARRLTHRGPTPSGAEADDDVDPITNSTSVDGGQMDKSDSPAVELRQGTMHGNRASDEQNETVGPSGKNDPNGDRPAVEKACADCPAQAELVLDVPSTVDEATLGNSSIKRLPGGIETDSGSDNVSAPGDAASKAARHEDDNVDTSEPDASRHRHTVAAVDGQERNSKSIAATCVSDAEKSNDTECTVKNAPGHPAASTVVKSDKTGRRKGTTHAIVHSRESQGSVANGKPYGDHESGTERRRSDKGENAEASSAQIADQPPHKASSRATPNRGPVIPERNNDCGDADVDHHGTVPVSTPSLSDESWTFPPFFEATAIIFTDCPERQVECTIECGIALDEVTEVAVSDEADPVTKSNCNEEGGPLASTLPGRTVHSEAHELAWQSLYCVYKVAATDVLPRNKIDLEDDGAQERLEKVLRQKYDLGMEDVLEWFSPETDLASEDAVIRAFAESIRQLRSRGARTIKNRNGKDTTSQSDEIWKSVEGALRGPLEWTEMLVDVQNCHVAGITATLATNDNVGNNIVSVSFPGAQASSPLDLEARALDSGMPESAMNALRRSGFLRPKSELLDVSHTFSALAQETREDRATRAMSPGDVTREADRGTPVLRLGRRKLHLSDVERTGGYEVAVDVSRTSTGMCVCLMQSVVAAEKAPHSQTIATAVGVKVSNVREQADRRRKLASRPVSLSRRPDLPGEQYRNAVGCSDVSNRDSLRGDSNVAPKKVVEVYTSDSNGLKAGDRVEARFGGKSEWYPGIVKAVRATGIVLGGETLHPTISIEYDDGDTEDDIPRVRVRLLGQKQPRLLKEGDEVDVKRGKRIALARVVRCRPAEDGRYDLRVLDKTQRLVEDVPRSAIMALHDWPPPCTQRPHPNTKKQA